MAEWFDVTGVIPFQRQGGATGLLDFIEVVGVTKPHGIIFTVEVPKQAGWKDAVLQAATAEAQELESAFTL